MANQTHSSTPGPQHDQAGGVTRARHCDEKRKRLVEMEYGLQAIESHLASIIRELESLESFTLTSLLARIRGDRTARIEETRERGQQVRDKLAETVAAVETLRREVEEIEHHRATEHPISGTSNGSSCAAGSGVAPPGKAASTEPADAPANDSTSEKHIKAIQRAIGSCNETRKGLLAEMEAAGTLGQCNIAAANVLISGLLGATTDRARKEIGRRVRGDVHRFSVCFNEVIAAGPAPAIAEELDARAKLAYFAEHFDGRWLQPSYPGSEAVDNLLQTLSLVDMLLEKRMKDAERDRSESGSRP